MEKLEKVFSSRIGIVIFYLIVALLAYLLTKTVESVNSQAERTSQTESYYA